MSDRRPKPQRIMRKAQAEASEEKGRETLDMKDSYVLQPDVNSEMTPNTDTDWVVIRRKSASDEVVQRPVAEDPVEDHGAELTEPVAPARPASRLEIMRRAAAALQDDLDVQPARTEPSAPAVEVEDTEDGLTDSWDADDLGEDAQTGSELAEPYETDVVAEIDTPVSGEPAVEDPELVDAWDVAENAEPEHEATPFEERAILENIVEPESDPEPEQIADLPPFELGAEHAVAVPDLAEPEAFNAEALWNALPRIAVGARVEGQPARRGVPSLVEYFRADPIAKGFDLLRTRLVRTIRAYGWRKIAIVSPTAGCGTTFTAVNLALSLSRVPGSRTILMDMNQRAPGVAEALGARNPNRLDDFLLGETAIEEYLVRPSTTLAVGLADAPNHLAAEMLHDPLTAEVLDDMVDMLDPDLVIYDMPPMLAHDDLAAFLPQVDGVLLVADGTKTLPEHISACERVLEGQTQLLGVVLNRGRAEGNTDVMV